VGRNKKENQTIHTLWEESDLLLSTLSVPGPTALVSGDMSPELTNLAVSMTVSYSDAENDELTEISIKGRGMDGERMARGRDKGEFRDYMI
jgi:hypothetical protein